ncbi:MAG: hypothetical protein M1831_001811 [Alyxoria varia]|nr:MAG: hypothetical protein M1831_001811 [Alyxoria varia]
MSWFSRFDPTPKFPPYTGPHPVGTQDIEIPLSNLPPTSYKPPATNPPITSISFRLFYPCKKLDTDVNPVSWIRYPQHTVISAYAKFLGAKSTLADIFAYWPWLLYRITIPAYAGAELADVPSAATAGQTPQKQQDGDTTNNSSSDSDAEAGAHPRRWPVLIFSHGLGGSSHLYSYLCASLASHGIVVAAADHRDGTQPIAHMRSTQQPALAEAIAVPYRNISHAQSEETFRARDEQLRIRLWELSMVLEALVEMDNPSGRVPLRNICRESEGQLGGVGLEMFRHALHVHDPGSVAFAGHSFGAATVAQLLKSSFYYPRVKTSIFEPCVKPQVVDPRHPRSLDPSQAYANQTDPDPLPNVLAQITSHTPALLFDLWALPWNSPATAALKAQPMPCFYYPAGTTSSTPTEAGTGEEPHDDENEPSKANKGPGSSPPDPSKPPFLKNIPAARHADADAERFETAGPGGATTLLAVVSESFKDWKTNFRDVKDLLSDPSRRKPFADSTNTGAEQRHETDKKPSAHLYHARTSSHISFSDFAVLYQRLTSYFTSRASDPQDIMNLNVRASLELLRRNKSGAWCALEPGPRLLASGHDDAGEDKAKENTKASEQGDDGFVMVERDGRTTTEAEPGNGTPDVAEMGMKGDVKILSATEGAVRDWIRIVPEERESDSEGAGSGAVGAAGKKDAEVGDGGEEPRPELGVGVGKEAPRPDLSVGAASSVAGKDW